MFYIKNYIKNYIYNTKMIDSLLDLCCIELIKQSKPLITIIDAVPYELFEIYKKRFITNEMSTIQSVVRCILSIEEYDIWDSCFGKQLKIVDCQRRRLKIVPKSYYDTDSMNEIRYYDTVMMREYSSSTERNRYTFQNIIKYNHIIYGPLEIKTYDDCDC
jgi:hypothetical protein